MPRKGYIAKREVLPDPMYNSKVVTKLVNNIMLDGKKSVAQKIVYGAFDIIKEKEQRDPLEVFEEALNNIMPVLEVKARRVGGATYQVPLEIRPERRQTLGLRWLVRYARTRHEKTMAEKLAGEIIDAINGNGGAFKKKEDSVTTVRPVKTARVESRSEIRKDFSGIVEAVDYVKLAFRVSGQIINLPVVEGQRVKKGQLIAAIDPRDLALQYAADKSAYETAAAQVERNKRLLARQAISVQEYEISVSTFQQKKSAYELSSNNMRDTRLTAPFDGSIEKRLVENYQRVNSGEGIVQLVNTKKLRIKFTIPDAYLYLLRSKDQRFRVEFDTYRGHIFNAKLEEYLDISTDGTGIPVTITIDDPAFDHALYEVKPGFTCSIRFSADVGPFLEESMTVVPLSAIFGESEGNKTYVWVLNGNQVNRREVTVYSPMGDAQAFISKGLKAGETVVTAGVTQLVEGETVKELK